MKTVLIIAYDFPPLRTSGVYRPLKFAKFLPEFGWRPIILTVKNFSDASLDHSLLKELPDEIRIYRAHSCELKRVEKVIFDRIYRSSTVIQSSPGAVTEKSEAPSAAAPRFGFSPKSLLKRILLSPVSRFTHNYLYNPDEWVGWIPMAVQTGRKAIRAENVDVIFSTSPPETNHLIGLWLKRLTGKPWVADFRDPWTDNVIKQDKPKARFNSERRAERRVLRKADAIINVGERFGRMSKESFPEIDQAKYSVITNGYDELDYVGFDAAAIYEKHQTFQLSILNVGTVYPNSGFDNFVRGLENVLSRPDCWGKIKLTIVGSLLGDQLAMLNREPLKSHVELKGFLPHSQALNQMMAADVILLMPSGGDSRTRDKIVPGKLFELLRSGRPLLMIGWDGESADMVRRSGSGLFVPAENVDEIEKAIIEFYSRKQSGLLQNQPNWDYIHQFDRKELTSKLVDVLELARSGTIASTAAAQSNESVPVK